MGAAAASCRPRTQKALDVSGADFPSCGGDHVEFYQPGWVHQKGCKFLVSKVGFVFVMG